LSPPSSYFFPFELPRRILFSTTNSQNFFFSRSKLMTPFFPFVLPSKFFLVHDEFKDRSPSLALCVIWTLLQHSLFPISLGLFFCPPTLSFCFIVVVHRFKPPKESLSIFLPPFCEFLNTALRTPIPQSPQSKQLRGNFLTKEGDCVFSSLKSACSSSSLPSAARCYSGRRLSFFCDGRWIIPGIRPPILTSSYDMRSPFRQPGLFSFSYAVPNGLFPSGAGDDICFFSVIWSFMIFFEIRKILCVLNEHPPRHSCLFLGDFPPHVPHRATYTWTLFFLSPPFPFDY